jgi:hypothetical protein
MVTEYGSDFIILRLIRPILDINKRVMKIKPSNGQIVIKKCVSFTALIMKC